MRWMDGSRVIAGKSVIFQMRHVNIYLSRAFSSGPIIIFLEIKERKKKNVVLCLSERKTEETGKTLPDMTFMCNNYC